jgi:hypothetical protein
MKAGEVLVVFSALAYETEERTVNIQPQGATQNVALQPKLELPSQLAGKVAHADTPIAGATVKALPIGGVELAQKTAEDGRFLFPQMDNCFHEIEASAAGYVTVRQSLMLTSGSNNTWEVFLEKDDTIVPTNDTELRTWLQSNFDTADTDGDSLLSFAEITARVPTLRQEVFDTVDTDGDGFISRDEAGIVENTPCCGGGGKSLWESLGDLILVGLLLTSLLATRLFQSTRP